MFSPKMFQATDVYIAALVASVILGPVYTFDTSFIHRFFYKSVDGSKTIPNGGKVDVQLLKPNSTELLPCDENKLMMRLANLQIISPERIVLMLLIEHHLELCEKLKINIADTKHEQSHCAPLAKDNLYWRLFQGMLVLNEELCSQKSALSQVLSSHELCIRDMREEFIDCEGPAAWYEKTDQEMVCQIFDDILDCQFVKTAELCGMKAAEILRCFSKDVLNGSLLNKCSLVEPPVVEFPMPIGSSSVIENNFILQFCVTFICIVFSINIRYS